MVRAAAILFISTLASCVSHGQDIHGLNQRMGRGVNLGNMFEAPTEDAWGNPWKADYPEIIADMGFDHVRLPIRWEPSERSSSTAPYDISQTFMERIEEVVDANLDEDLMVIINMHHHEALFESPADEKDRFLAQWEQIAEEFKDYSDELVFEILNEPHGNMTPEIWNEYLADAIEVIRESNPTRAILVGTAEYGGLAALPDLVLPEDDNLIVTIHYYNPFPFTHQGANWVGEQSLEWLGTEWNDTDIEREVIENEFAPLFTFAEQNDMPVNIGEFGAFSTADLVSRVKWTTFLARYFEQQEWSWAYWEFSAGFGIYDPDTEEVLQELADALLVNVMPEPLVYTRTEVYTSNFANSTDGWQLSTNGGSSGSLTNGDNDLNISINQVGSENWHVQLSRGNFNLQSGEKYAVSFTASAVAKRSVSVYMGGSSDPWPQYGGTSIEIGEASNSFSFLIDMTTTDNTARLVFDLGSSANDLVIEEIKVEHLTLDEISDPTTITSLDPNYKTSIYPNPVTDQLTIENTSFSKAILFNASGRVVRSINLLDGHNTVDLLNATPGIYLLRLIGTQGITAQKVLVR